VSKTKKAETERARIPVLCSVQQRELLRAAADKIDSDMSTFCLAYALKAADGVDLPGAPIVLGGKVAQRLRDAAKASGQTPERLLDTMLVAR
jgi:uncharacterized protein (DUF1778 family)